jgi:hypothetical protein
MLLSHRTFVRRIRMAALRRLVRVGLWAQARLRKETVAAQTETGLAAVRLSICQSCPKFKGAPPFERCSACGCVMRAKVQFPHAMCPDGRW